MSEKRHNGLWIKKQMNKNSMILEIKGVSIKILQIKTNQFKL